MDQAVQPPAGPSEALLENHDFALFFDGERRFAKRSMREQDGDVIIEFRTTRAALADPTIDVTAVTHWGGWKAGETAHVFSRRWTASPLPENGYVLIHSLRPGAAEGDPSFFACKALTDVHDWVEDKLICPASDFCIIPTTWFRR